MPILRFFRRFFTPAEQKLVTGAKPEEFVPKPYRVRRHFFNLKTLQCYGTFFPYWDGWISAGHVLTSSQHKWPPYADKNNPELWPGGLDAAVNGCEVPKAPPATPYAGQAVRILGFPAGSRNLETRMGKVYMERTTGSGNWIAHIQAPDEPVVTGMSGGPVIDIKTDLPIGILITRNSPADLDKDQIPDQSCDFVALSAVWEVLQSQDRQSKERLA